MDDYGEKVRRKGNKELPELSSQRKDMMDLEESENFSRRDEETNHPMGVGDMTQEPGATGNPDDINEEKNENIPVILKIKYKEKSPISWDSIDEFKKLNPELNVQYSRLFDTEGYIVISIQKEQKYDEIKFKDKFIFEGMEFTVEKCEEEELDKFWKDQGPYYEYYMKRREKLDKLRKNKDQRQKEFMATESSKERENQCHGNGIQIILGNKIYYDSDIDLIRKDANNILRKYNHNEKVEGEDKDFILDLLKYHSKYEEITKNLDYITVDINERFKFLKSFYIVEKNNNRIKFSSKSCVQNIAKKFNIE